MIYLLIDDSTKNPQFLILFYDKISVFLIQIRLRANIKYQLISSDLNKKILTKSSE